MAQLKRMAGERLCFRCSSSIENFKEKLEKRYSDYSGWNMFCPTIFFGAYHFLDWLRILVHRSRRTIFWCGSDILNLKGSLWRFITPRLKIRHVCENVVEHEALLRIGINAEIHPMIFADPNDYPVTYKHSDNPKVFMCLHEGREAEYGLGTVLRLAQDCRGVTFHIYGETNLRTAPKNVVFHGRIPEGQFNREIKGYHGSLRLNSFDGFSEITAKSILLGQYPIVANIYYPHLDVARSYSEMVQYILSLKKRKRPNQYRNVWYSILTKRVEA